MAEAGPLSQDDLTELKAKLADLDTADKLIDQAKRAGIDMTTQLDRARELRDRLVKLKQAFWPGQ